MFKEGDRVITKYTGCNECNGKTGTIREVHASQKPWRDTEYTFDFDKGWTCVDSERWSEKCLELIFSVEVIEQTYEIA